MDKKYTKALKAVLHKTKKDILKWERISLNPTKNRYLSIYIKKNNLNSSNCKLFACYYRGGYIFTEINKESNDVNIFFQPNIKANLTHIKTKHEDVLDEIVKEIYHQEKNHKHRELHDFIEELLDD